MAARLHPALCRPPEIVDLRRVTAHDLEPLLLEETDAWHAELEWDFEKSADLVRRFVDLRALNGSALIENGLVAGYLYYVLEDGKGLIGDLYVKRAQRTVQRENAASKAEVNGASSRMVLPSTCVMTRSQERSSVPGFQSRYEPMSRDGKRFIPTAEIHAFVLGWSIRTASPTFRPSVESSRRRFAPTGTYLSATARTLPETRTASPRI